MFLCSVKNKSLQKDVMNLGTGHEGDMWSRVYLLYFLNLDPYERITQFKITFF